MVMGSEVKVTETFECALQNDEIWTRNLRLLWCDPVELTAADHV